MTIETLLKVLPPPAEPFETFDGPWEPIEAALGVVVPQDYKDFVRIFGNGSFLDFLMVLIPRSRSYNLWIVPSVRRAREMFRGLDDVPYTLWPHPQGLILCGGTDDGDSLFWLPRPAPEPWSIVVWDRGFGEFETFECDLTDFLAGLVTGEILPKQFPDGLLPCEPLFAPLK